MKVKTPKLTPQQKAQILGDPKLSEHDKQSILWLLSQPRPTAQDRAAHKAKRKWQMDIQQKLAAKGVPIITEVLDHKGHVHEWRLSLRGLVGRVSVTIGMPNSSSPSGS